MLSASTSKHDEVVARAFETSSFGESDISGGPRYEDIRSHRSAHCFIRDSQEPGSDLLQAEFVGLSIVDFSRQLIEKGFARFDVERLVLVGTEDLGTKPSDHYGTMPYKCSGSRRPRMRLASVTARGPPLR